MITRKTTVEEFTEILNSLKATTIQVDHTVRNFTKSWATEITDVNSNYVHFIDKNGKEDSIRIPDIKHIRVSETKVVIEHPGEQQYIFRFTAK